MTTNKKDYEVYYPFKLDDVTLVACFPDGMERMQSSCFWEKLADGLVSLEMTYKGPSPSEFMKKTLVGTVVDQLPVVLKLLLSGDDNYIGLTYFYEDNVELHLPESYLLSGCREEDVKRWSNFWRIGESFEKAIDVSWSYIEWPGQEYSSCLDQSIIVRHRTSLYERAGCGGT